MTNTITHWSPYIFVFICGIIVTIIAFTAGQAFFSQPTKRNIHNHFFVDIPEKIYESRIANTNYGRPVTVFSQDLIDGKWVEEIVGAGSFVSFDGKRAVAVLKTGRTVVVSASLIRFDDVDGVK